MKIEFTGRQTDVSAELRSATEAKLAKLAKVLHGITHVHVILTVDKHREIAEVTVHSSRLNLTAVEESGELQSSVATVIERLIRQAQRHLGKVRTRKRHGARREEALWSGVLAPAPSEGGGGPRVVESRRFLPKPMSVDEAVSEMGHAGEDLLVFRDAESARIHVLYRRKDGNLGIIEPEA